MRTSHVEPDARLWNVGEGDFRERLSPLDWLAKAGIGLLSFFAQLTGDAPGGSPVGRTAEATDLPRPEEEPVPDCCNLYFPEGPFCEYEGHKSNYRCPEGYNKQYWPCCEGTRLVACGECTQSTTTCWEGEFVCSIWWWMDGSC
jgi:hypothetical protein